MENENPTRYKKLYYMLLDNIPSSVIMFDKSIRVVSANQNFLIKSKRLAKDTVGKHIKDIFHEVILNQTNLADKINRVFQTEIPNDGERMSFRAPSIPLKYYYYRIIPTFWNNSIENAVLLMDDVTSQIELNKEIQNIQKHLARIVESANDVIISTDFNGKILSWNRAAEDKTGFASLEVIGKSFFKLCELSDKTMVEQIFNELNNTGNTKKAEWKLNTKNNEKITVSWVCSMMFDENSDYSNIVAIGRDLTKQRKLETQLFQSQKLAALGMMAGGIAHEIRNPLGICHSAAQFLMDKNLNPDLRIKYAEKIHKHLIRASTTIENLLNFAHPASKGNKEKIIINTLVEESTNLVKHQASLEKVRINFND